MSGRRCGEAPSRPGRLGGPSGVRRVGLARIGAVALPLAAALAAGGCFATREDVRLLQTDLSSLRAERAQADSARRAEHDRVNAQLAQVTDSLRVVSARTLKADGDIRGDLFAIGQQLIQIQELTGQSQTKLQELKAQLEQKGATIASSAGPAGGGGAGAVGSAVAGDSSRSAAGGPGPNQLFQLALDQLRRGSTGAARAGFQDLLRQYPNASVAPDAQFYLAESYAQEGNMAAADSGYLAVGARYPTSSRAAAALYKHASVMEAAHNVQAARAAYQDVIRKYPRSDEAVLAKERLPSLR
jgi:tol-pal system protein YbgF